MAYNVLIADDSASIRSIVAKALRHSGVPLGEIHMAGDGYQALEVLGSEWVDIVLADLNMPKMGGIELIERMRHQGITGRVPVVVVSTEGRREVIESLLSGGATAFLRKPFAPEELGALVRSVLDGPQEPPAEESLQTAFFEAVEGFAMLVAELEAEPAPAPERALVARVRFVGPGTQGEVFLAASPEACDLIARSATGEEEGDGVDALSELANTTAGQLIGRIAGGPFALHPPVRDERDGASAWAQVCEQGTSSTFDVEGHPVAVGVDAKKRW